ncbi:MAG: ribonuclease R, partial [Bacteroidota bacterium]
MSKKKTSSKGRSNRKPKNDRRNDSPQQRPQPPARNIDQLPELERIILDVLQEEYTQYMNVKQVNGRHPEIQSSYTYEDIERGLLRLAYEGFVSVEDHKYRVDLVGRFFEGEIKVFARDDYALVWTKLLPDPLKIERVKSIKAFSGDKVKVQVVQVTKHNILAELVDVTDRAQDTFIGIIEYGKSTNYFRPQDAFLKQDIVVPNKELNGAQDGERCRVQVTHFRSGKPYGKVIEVMGEVGTHEEEMHAIISEFRLDPSFSKSTLNEVSQISPGLDDAEIKKRKDYRDVLTITIDPEDAKDFDDALSFKKLKNGDVEIGVHIADVTHYVKPGSALDEDAFRKATSVYLVDRTIPMLPEKLSNNLCSLRPNEDRPAFAAIFTLNSKTGTVKNEWYGRTVIHSDRRFSYEEVQQILNDGKGELYEELSEMNRLAKLRREERFKQGSISFETDEVRFRLDDDGRPIEAFIKPRFDAHKLIEEFMLMANRHVAEWLHSKRKNPELPIPYRVHPTPDNEKLNNFKKFISRFGMHFRANPDMSKQKIASAINEVTKAVEGQPEEQIINDMAIRSMSKAFYTTVNVGHYGLGFDHYAHFTSPIRRYPDVMLHRLLEAVLEGNDIPDKTQIEYQCEHSSEREVVATKAERASIKYKQAEYLGAHVGEAYTGIISGIMDWGIYVLLRENGCEGMAWLADIKDDHYLVDETKHYARG